DRQEPRAHGAGVHAAHQLRPAFPNEQLYVNLRGADTQALAPAEILGEFLRALGVEGQCLPHDVDSRAGLYRSLLADRRGVGGLDNTSAEGPGPPRRAAGARDTRRVPPPGPA